MAPPEAIIKQALDSIRQSLNTGDDRDFSVTVVADVRREAQMIEKEQGGRRDLRYMRRIEPYLASLEEYAGVVEVFCQGYSPMAFVWVHCTP